MTFTAVPGWGISNGESVSTNRTDAVDEEDSEVDDHGAQEIECHGDGLRSKPGALSLHLE